MRRLPMHNQEQTQPDKACLYQQGFEFSKYRDLPDHYQMAMAWYMAIDGEAWCDIIDYDKLIPRKLNTIDLQTLHSRYKEELRRLLPKFIEVYGEVEFGIAKWSTDSLLTSIAKDDAFVEDGRTPDETKILFREPIKGYYTTNHPESNRWPVILSNHNDETLQDGWHRFHIYVSAGHEDIPVIFYPTDWHRELKAEMDLQGAPLVF